MTENERLDLMVEGEHCDHRVQDEQFGDGERPAPMHQRALGLADENGHIVRRTATLGKDELLHVDHRGNLSVAGAEYTVVESAGDYHCSCGEHFDGPEEAHEHLLAQAADDETEVVEA